MAGTKIGALKAKAKNKAKDPEYYRKIGSLGGQKSRGGGFQAGNDLARLAGAKGGQNGRRSGSAPVKVLPPKPQDLGLIVCKECDRAHFEGKVHE